MNSRDGRSRRDIINKAKRRYKIAWRDYPCIFDQCRRELVYLIWEFLGNPLEIYSLLSTNAWFSTFRNDEVIWKSCYLNWFSNGSRSPDWFQAIGACSRLEYLNLPSIIAEKGMLTHKGLICQTYEMLKSFWWKDSRILSGDFKATPSWLGDLSSGVYLYDRLLIPSIEKNGRVKIFYIPSIGYFMSVLTNNRFELYKLNTNSSK